MDLEAPATSTTVTPDTPAPTTVSPAVTTPEPTVEPEVAEHVYTDQRGQQAVPLATFLEAKKAAKAAADEAKAVREEAAQLKGWAQQWSPYLSALAQRPDLLQQALGQTAPSQAATVQPETDPEAEQLARELDLYTPAGVPDVARAQRMLKVMDGRVDKRVAREVEPVRLASEEAKAAALRQQAFDYASRTGYAPTQALQQVLALIPPALQADQNVMNLALVLARGLGTTTAPTLVTAPSTPSLSPLSEPLMTEAPGRRQGPPPLSEMEQRVATNRGIAPERWRKLTDTTNPVLE